LVVEAAAVLVLLVQRRLLQLLALAGLEQHHQLLVQALRMQAVAAVEQEQVQQVV